VLAPGPPQRRVLTGAVAQLLAAQDARAVSLLTGLGIRYLYLDPAGETLPPVLDAVDGLVRASAPPGAAVWRIDQPVGPMRLLSGADKTVVAQDPRAADFPLSDATGRTLQLAEAADPGWRASATNGPVASVPDEALATFRLPDGPGTVSVAYRDDQRRLLLWLQLAALAIGLVLAFPGLARAAEADASLSIRDTGSAPGRRAR
jgi:hypothetical protein